MSDAGASGQPRFEQAQPIWLQGRSTEMNVWAGFRAVVDPQAVTGEIVLRVTASCLYRCTVNGAFVGHGPAVAAHGFFRVDEWRLGPYLKPGRNVVALEVAGYNVNSFYTLDQPSFVQAEIGAGQELLAATGAAGLDFEALELTHRIQRVERYSYQRAFAESYTLKPGYDDWQKIADASFEKAPTETQPAVKLLNRGVDHPEYAIRRPEKLVSAGRLEPCMPEEPWTDRMINQIGPQIKGFQPEELERQHWLELQQWTTAGRRQAAEGHSPAPESIALNEKDTVILDYGANLTGFIGVALTCTAPARLYLTFDEILMDEDVEFNRIRSVSMVHAELQPGSYRLETLEPYTLRYLKLLAVEGGCRVEGLYLREYAGSVRPEAAFSASDARLDKIFHAGVETYRQNAVDNFLDCPSRERAGWLCDSFFTARVSQELTGELKLENNFIENFMLPERFYNLPEGMLPMCYPADFYKKQFIPNWALWFVVQLEEYAARGGKEALVQGMCAKVESLFRYFEGFRNEDGLLEKLESWIFVEWSMANKLVQDVNYPTNMLYAGALSAAGRLYGRADWIREGERIRETIRAQSYDGEFFRDRAKREPDGGLQVTPDRTEVCQYYAFYFAIAAPSTHPKLWDALVRDFGPDRKRTGKHPDIHPANAFIGNYLRLELLSREGLSAQIIDEMAGYFLYMAERTGTLWEHDDVRASCNHGFASHVVHLLYRDVLGVREVDRSAKTIAIRIPRMEMQECQGSMPLGDGVLKVAWRRSGDEVQYDVAAPEGYSVKVEKG